jgi:ABC-type branched-subunit amino acid transport system permease subunit
MPFWFTLVMMMLFSALPAAVVWALVQKLPQIARIIVSIIAGMMPLCFVGWSVYRGEGGNRDLDPLQFLYMTIGVSFVCALVAIAAMEWRLRQR